jgi:hypothetical protein
MITSKLSRGWKPNQFVDGPAKQFLHQGSDDGTEIGNGA